MNISVSYWTMAVSFNDPVQVCQTAFGLDFLNNLYDFYFYFGNEKYAFNLVA